MDSSTTHWSLTTTTPSVDRMNYDPRRFHNAGAAGLMSSERTTASADATTIRSVLDLTLSEERDVRRRLDGAISRALVDRDYAAKLLAHPQATLGAQELDSKYRTLHELAQHMMRLFWPPSLSPITTEPPLRAE
jgi:hypothetical protein